MRKCLLLGILMIVLGALIAYAAPPVVTLVNPANGATDNDGDVTFEYSVTDDLTNITQCQLWTNISGAWTATDTDTSISMGANSFTRTGINDGLSFLWNIQCTDSEANSVFAASNRTVDVDYPKLIMYDMKVYVDGKKHSGIDEGCVDDICDIEDDVYPGSEIRIVMEFKNIYDNDAEDLDIEDINIEAILAEIDDGDDIEEDTDINRLRAEDKETVELMFEIPLAVEEGTYDLDINIDAEDEDGNDQGFDFGFNVKVDKKSHEIIIQRAELTKDTVSCTRDTRLEVKIMNIGARDEDEVELEVKNEQLGINMRKTNIPELESDPDGDNEYETSFDLSIDEDAVAGTYPLALIVYFSGDVHSDAVDVDLVVQDCAAKQTQQDTSADDTSGSSADTSDAAGEFDHTIPDYVLQDFGITESVETSFKDSAAYIVLLVVAILAAVGSITLLVVLLLRR